MTCRRITLGEHELPHYWYNLAADLPEPVPPLLHPITRQPLQPQQLEPIFARGLIEQEWSLDPWIGIPDEVRRMLAIWRPTPLIRAAALEKKLKTPARIYFKDESQSPPGSHKPNTAIPQAYYSKQEGVRRLCTETGAGQWGCSLALACSLLDIQCKVFMVRLSYDQKPYRRSMMRLWGADITASPSQETDVGRPILADDPDCPGSIGIAISEAVETAARSDDTKYAIGSVLNHVILHQTVIGLEARKQFELIGDTPDVVIGCAGGGSNFAGLAFPYVCEKLDGRDTRFVAAEPKACPTVTCGDYRYDSPDTTALIPLVKMFTLDHQFVPPAIRASGLRYHGMSPLVSLLANLGVVESVAFSQTECFEAARLFALTEGTIPALETSYAIRAAIDEALLCRETRQQKCIVFAFSGHGLCDLHSYEDYLEGRIEDFGYPRPQLQPAAAEPSQEAAKRAFRCSSS